MKLHTYGLLRNSFRPPQEVRPLRTYWRQRNDLIRAAGRRIQRMQKALSQMNIQFANVLSDISAKSGQAIIIKAILAGKRDPGELVALCGCRVKASPEEAAGSLEGNWQDDLLFVLQQGGARVLSEANGRVRLPAPGVSPAPARSEPKCQSAGRESQRTTQEEERQ